MHDRNAALGTKRRIRLEVEPTDSAGAGSAGDFDPGAAGPAKVGVRDGGDAAMHAIHVVASMQNSK